MIKDSNKGYGIISRLIHWVSAFVVIGLFASGLYMVDLDYYDDLYHTLPSIHKSVGILLAIAFVFRILWRVFNTKPPKEPSVKGWEQRLANVVQKLMLLLMIIVIILGYMISTAAGDPIAVFDWFEVPAVNLGIENQADFAGLWHFYIAWALIILASLHALAALKHHFIDKDRTLMRMLKGE